MQAGIFRFGPQLLAVGAANVLNPPSLTGGVLNGGSFSGSAYGDLYVVLRHIRVVNKSASAQVLSLWIGATGASAAGTEFAWANYSIPANSYVDWYGSARLDVADYLTGQGGTGAELTITGEGEIAIV